MKTKSMPILGFGQDPMTLARFGELLGHVIAIACAVCGLYFIIIADSLDSAVYGIGLFGLAIALDVIVASRCEDKTVRRREIPHARLVNIRAKKRRRAKA